MPAFEVSSPAGKKYRIDLPEGTEVSDELQADILRDIQDYESGFEQSSAGVFGNKVAQGLGSVISEPVRGAGELFEIPYLREAGENLNKSLESEFAVSPDQADSFAAKAGGAVGQGLGQLGLALGSAGVGLGLKGIQATTLAPAFLSGAAGGADESRRLGLEGTWSDKFNQIAGGSVELLSESIFGLGSKAFGKELISDVPNVLIRGSKTSALGRFAKGVGQEALEEPIAGAGQDFASRISAEFGGAVDPNNPDQTLNGAELRSPFDLGERAEEALFGLVGAGPFGIHAALNRDADTQEVLEYRNKVAEARKAGNIPQDRVSAVDDYDTKAETFLETEGVDRLKALLQSAADGTSQGARELQQVIDDDTTPPAAQAAASVRLEQQKEAAAKALGAMTKFEEDGRTPAALVDLRNAIPEYETLNPFSKTNQTQALEKTQEAKAAVPVQAAVNENLAAGNNATAAALIDVQTSRAKAGQFRKQAREARKATPAQASTTTAQQTTPITSTNSVSQEVKTSAVSREDQIANQFPKVFNDTVNTLVPQRVRNVSEALERGDLARATAELDTLRKVAQFGFINPEISRVISARFSPEQQAKFKNDREAVNALVEEVAKSVETRAAEAGRGVAENEVRQQPVEELPLFSQEPAASLAVVEEVAPAEETPSAPTTEEIAPTPAPNPELEAVDAQIAIAKAKAAKARAKVRASLGKTNFGVNPLEQAALSARMLSSHAELGYLLLKKGFIKFKAWSREFLKNADPDATYLLRRIYRMLRDTPAEVEQMLHLAEGSVASISPSLEAGSVASRIPLDTVPGVDSPLGVFGSDINLMDWAGNTTFFEGRASMKGAGKGHRIFIKPSEGDDLLNPNHKVSYIYEGVVYDTGDVVTRTETGWVFNGRAAESFRGEKFHQYTTTAINLPFTEAARATPAEQLRTQNNAFAKVVQFNDEGRLAFKSESDIARWAASTRFVDGDYRFPVSLDQPASDRITVSPSGNNRVLGTFVKVGDQFVFNGDQDFTKTNEDLQLQFEVLGFEVQGSGGTVTQANTPAKVVAAWGVPSQTYKVLEGFGAAPISPREQRILPAKKDPPFKGYTELLAWVTEKRLKQGHRLDINQIRNYVKDRGPRAVAKQLDKAIKAAEETYSERYPVEVADPKSITELRDNHNIGVQYARFVNSETGLQPLFTNNVFETAVQINMGYRPIIPASYTSEIHPSIQIETQPDGSRLVVSASDASGKVSKEGDHLRVRQGDPRVVAKSEARIMSEDEVISSIGADYEFVDGLPTGKGESETLQEAVKRFSKMPRPSSTIGDPILVESLATSMLVKQLRLEVLRPVVEEAGYARDGQVTDETKREAAIKAVRDFISERKARAESQRTALREEGESTRGIEEIFVLPDRLENLVDAAVNAFVLRHSTGGPVNFKAYWNRATNRLLQKYRTRLNSGFAAPVATVEYNEEGTEQTGLEDEEQVVAKLVEEGFPGGGFLSIDSATETESETDEGFLVPEIKTSAPKQLDLFTGKPETEEFEDEEDPTPTESLEEPDLEENPLPALTAPLTTEDNVEAEKQNADRIQMSAAVATQRNKQQRSAMRRILRGLPVDLQNAVFNSPTVDRFDRIAELYRVMRVALIRANVIRSEDRPNFIDALNLVFQHKTKVRGFDKMFPVGTKEIFSQFYRAQQGAPGNPASAQALEVINELGLESGNPQSAIDSLAVIAKSSKVSEETQVLASRLLDLPNVKNIRGFSVLPMSGYRGVYATTEHAITVAPQESFADMAETLVHEFSHAALEGAFQEIQLGNASESVVRANDELTKLREELAKASMARSFTGQYAAALESNEEFVATFMSDPAFNAWVSARPRSFLQKILNALRRLLGLPASVDKTWGHILTMADRPAMFAQTKEAVSAQFLEHLILSDGGNLRPLFAGTSANVPEGLKADFILAQDMADAGQHPSTVYKATGWFKAPTDKQWRWEISDADAGLHVPWTELAPGDETKLGDLLDHPRLFQAYPELQEVPVLIKRLDPGVRGRATQNKWGQPVVEVSFNMTSPRGLSTLLHEAQHLLQTREGFFPGTNVRDAKAYAEESGTAYEAYRKFPGEIEARATQSRQNIPEEARRLRTPLPWYPVTDIVLKLRNAASKGFVAAAQEVAEESPIEFSTERNSPAWYDNGKKTIFLNPEIVAKETASMNEKAAKNYAVKLIKHENIHRADLQGSNLEDVLAYRDAMTEADREWIANLYWPDPAQRERALGRAPGMSPEEISDARTALALEHRRAMIELATTGETTEQFVLLAIQNPGLAKRALDAVVKFFRKLVAQLNIRNYEGSALDLQTLLENINDMVDAPGIDASDIDLAFANSVAIPLRSRNQGSYKAGGWATTGYLNAETAESTKERDAKLRSIQTQIQMHRDDLAAAVKEEYTKNKQPDPEVLINTALGSIENPVSPKQLAIAEAFRTRSIRNAVGAFLSEMNRANNTVDPAQAALIRETARKTYGQALKAAKGMHRRYLANIEDRWIASARAKQAAAFAALAPKTSAAVRKIRDDLNEQQDRLIASGLLGPKTAARVAKTHGIYLSRSYQIFNEKLVTATGVKRNLWSEFLRRQNDPAAVKILDGARAAIFEEAAVERAKQIRKDNTRARNPVGPFKSVADQKAAIKLARKTNPPISAGDALTQARQEIKLNPAAVDRKLAEYIALGEEMENDTDVLKHRENIHPAIQALWGVYEKNTYNAFNTMAKINALLANQKMFQDIYNHGKSRGYIFDDPNHTIDGFLVVPLGGTGTQQNRNRFGALAGTYGPSYLAAGLQETFGNSVSVSTIWNVMRAFTGYAMATKTKYSIQGTARNFLGNIMFAAVNMNLHKLLNPKAYQVVARQLNTLSADKTRFDEYIKKLIELRVVSESAYEFRELSREFSNQYLTRFDAFISGKKGLDAAAKTVRAVDKVAGRLHQSADDFWKVVAFEGELNRVKRWEPNLSQEAAEAKAAWKIRQTMPTYTEAFYFIKRLRQQPFVAPFVTFTSEMYRITFGTLKVGLTEMKEGHRNGNLVQVGFGLARCMMLASSLGFTSYALGAIAREVFGVGSDDDEDSYSLLGGESALSRFVPEYMQGNSLLRFGSKGWNEQVYMDASYLIPQDIIGKVIRMSIDAATKPEAGNAAERAVDAGAAFIKQVLEPVTKEQLFFGSVMQAYYNYNRAYDRKIYKDTDTAWEATSAIVRHIYTSALEPGTVRTGRLIWEAADGVVRDGMKLEVPNEAMGILGIKKRTIVLDTRFQKNADMNKMKLTEASQYVTTPLQSNSTVPDDEVTGGYRRANEVRMDILRDARRDYLAAQQLGMPQGKAIALLRDSQLSEAEVGMVTGNYYVPYQVSSQVFEKAMEKSKSIGQDRTRLYIQAVKDYPKRQPLIPEP